MAGFTWVHKERGGASTGQGCSNLVAYMAGLTHTCYHYSAFTGENSLAGKGKVAINAGKHGAYGLGFQFYSAYA